MHRSKRKYRSVSLHRYTHGLLQRVGEHMTGGKILDMKAKSIPEVITILAESYHINNIVIPNNMEKEWRNEI
jgi:hypothetical protein|tara:strand:+ start:217 stop:432 length:216 start_codon:yes stop_codon:yes gene_type:complete